MRRLFSLPEGFREKTSVKQRQDDITMYIDVEINVDMYVFLDILFSLLRYEGSRGKRTKCIYEVICCSRISRFVFCRYQNFLSLIHARVFLVILSIFLLS